MHFVDEELIFEAVGPVGDPDVYTRLDRKDVVQDPTAKTVADEAQRLCEHIPVRDGRLHDALQLSKWLAAARDSSPPARLVLSGRIIEQTANWAGLKPQSLIEDYLSWVWARNKIAGDLAKAGYHGIMRLPGGNGRTSSASERNKFLRIRQEVINETSGQMRLRTFAVLPHLDWLVEQHAASTETGDYLRELQRRVANGPAVVSWIEKLRDELKVRNARAVRTRNALVHGGPLITAIAESVVEMLDGLGSQALARPDWPRACKRARRPGRYGQGCRHRRHSTSRATCRPRNKSGSPFPAQLPSGSAPTARRFTEARSRSTRS